MINEVISAKEKENKQKAIFLYTDGACRGNNQKDRDKRISGIGFHYQLDGIQYSGSQFAEKEKTNNESEFKAILEGLSHILNNTNYKNEIIVVKSDCLYCVDRINNKYPIKAFRLLQYYNKIKKIEEKLNKVHYNHILRDNNYLADELANKGIDDYLMNNQNNKKLDHIDLLTNLLKDCESEEIFKEIKEAIQHSSLKELKEILRIK